MRLGIISNPLSGGNRKGLQPVREAIARRPGVVHREAQTPPEVESAMKVLAGEGVGIVAVNGGDGTIQAVLTALFGAGPFERPPILAVLRSGTDSVIAEDVGLKGSRDRGLGRLLRWMETQDGGFRLLGRPVLKVEAPPDPHPRYGMIFGGAAVYQGIQYCKRRFHTVGLYGKIATTLTLARFLLAVLRHDRRVCTPVPMSIRMDHAAPVQGNFLLLYISTLERLFLGIRPHWGVEAGPLHLTAVADRPRHFIRVFPSAVRGRGSVWGSPENGYYSHNAREIRMSMDGGFNLDGELYTPDPLHKSVTVSLGGSATFIKL